MTAAWTALAFSADGARLAASGAVGFRPESVRVSADGGQTWQMPKFNGYYDITGQAVAVSTNGLRLVATERTFTWWSLDGGATWLADEALCLGGAEKQGAGLAMSADGRRVAAAFNASLCVSADGGQTWARELGDAPHNWIGIAGSADGERLLAADLEGYLHLKAAGAWTALTSPGKLAWRSVACSTDGRTLFAVAAGGGSATPPTVFRSTDGGATWLSKIVATALPAEPQSMQVAASSDGARLALIVSTETAGQAHIYTSTDGGASWSRQAGAGARPYQVLAMSADGRRLAAGAHIDIIYLSDDGGVTWQ